MPAKKGSVKKKAPTPKNKTAKAARRVAIVKGLLDQKTPRAIAKGIGISRKTVYEELKAPETQQLIQRWLEPYHNDIEAMIPMAITAVRDSIGPTRRVKVGDEVMDRENETIDRLRAAKTLGMIMGWAQGKTSPVDDETPLRKFSGTMEELLVVYRTLTAGESQGAPAS